MRDGAGEKACRVVAAAATDVGRQRDHNEDSFAVLEEHGLYVVADGMGGHTAGDVASKLATQTLVDFFKQTDIEDATWPAGFNVKMTEEENRLMTGIRLANRQVFERSITSKDLRGMGTTVVGATFSKDRSKIAVAHVGDSRAYRLREGKLQQLTRDHSLLSDILEAMPDLPEEQRAELPKNVVTRALGVQDSVNVDIGSFDVKQGDVFILCSDGLSGMVADEEILSIVDTSPDPEVACRRLVRTANDHGGEDNVTVLVVRVASPTDAIQADTLAPGAATDAPPPAPDSTRGGPSPGV
jgi:serine/threonine protein phosphatase PrpC